MWAEMSFEGPSFCGLHIIHENGKICVQVKFASIKNCTSKVLIMIEITLATAWKELIHVCYAHFNLNQIDL